MTRLALLACLGACALESAAQAAPIPQGSLDVAWFYQGPTGTFPTNFDVGPQGETVVCFAPNVSIPPNLPVIVALDTAGKAVWTRGTLDGPAAVAVHPSGQVTIAEAVRQSNPNVPGVSGPWDGHLSRVDSNGQILWQTHFGGTGTDSVTAVLADGEGIIVAGSSNSLSGFGDPSSGSNGYVASFDAMGTLNWLTRIPGPGGAEISIRHIAKNPAGGLTVAGRFIAFEDAPCRIYEADLDINGSVTHSLVGPIGHWGSFRYLADGSNLTTYAEDPEGVPTTTLCLSGSAWGCTSVTPISSLPAAWGADQLGSGDILQSASEAPLGFTGLRRIDAVTGAPLERLDVRLSPSQNLSLGAIEIDEADTVRAIASADFFTTGIVRLVPTSPIVREVCSGVSNSAGAGATLHATGSDERALNDFVLVAKGLPTEAATLFLASRQSGSVMNPGGSQGNLCLGGAIGRFLGPGQLQSSSVHGNASMRADLSALPQPNSQASAVIGETWYFQAWYRDANPGTTSNFTSAVGLTLQ